MLTALFNCWLIGPKVPNYNLKPRTIFVLKKGDLISWSNRRPLPIGHVVNYIFCQILARRLTVTVPIHPQQTGFKLGCLCAENLMIVRTCLQISKTEKRNLYVIFLDLAKIFINFFINSFSVYNTAGTYL